MTQAPEDEQTGSVPVEKAETKRRVLVNASWLMSERALRTIIGFLVSTAVARHLGPEELGVLSYAQSLVFVAAGIAGLGLDQILVRELVRTPEQRDSLLGTVLGLRVVGSVATSLLLLAVLSAGGDSVLVGQLVMILALGGLFDSFNVVDHYFTSQIRSGSAVRLRVVVLLATSGLRLLIVLFDGGVQFLAWAQAAGSLLQAAGFVFVYRDRERTLMRWRFHAKTAGALLKLSWPLAVTGLVLHVQARADQLLLGRTLAPEVLGNYSVAIKLSEAVTVLPTVIVTTLTPLVVEVAGDPVAYRRRLTQLYQVLNAAAFCVALPVAILGPFVVPLIYGNRFREAGPLFALCSVRVVLAHWGMGRNVFLVSEGLTLFSFVTMSVATVFNVACNLVLIPRYGAQGAVLAMALSFGAMFFMDYFHPRTRQNLRFMLNGILSSWNIALLVRTLRRR